MRELCAILLFVVFVSLGCGTGPESDAPEPESAHGGVHEEHDSAAATRARPELYEARATVLWSEPGRIYLNHEEMPGFMDAMAMGFDVRDRSILEGIDPGSDVQFRVVVEADTFYIDQIHPVE